MQPIGEIGAKKFGRIEDPKFSILIPSWNNKAFLQLCIESIQKNSVFQHQIIVHVNDGSDGTLELLEAQRIDHTFSAENVGICYALNAAANISSSDILVYMNDDMYVCPDWDKAIVDEIKAIGHDRFFLASTMLEPRSSGNPCVIAPFEAGTDPASFNEEKLLNEFNIEQIADKQGTTWPPSVMHKRMWDLVGGMSVEFSPGMYSDPDLCMKLWMAGVRYFKGLSRSRVYHFQSATTLRIKKNDGKKQFLNKWKVSASYFVNEILERGKDWIGPLPDKSIEAPLKDKVKRMVP